MVFNSNNEDLDEQNEPASWCRKLFFQTKRSRKEFQRFRKMSEIHCEAKLSPMIHLRSLEEGL